MITNLKDKIHFDAALKTLREKYGLWKNDSYDGKQWYYFGPPARYVIMYSDSTFIEYEDKGLLDKAKAEAAKRKAAVDAAAQKQIEDSMRGHL